MPIFRTFDMTFSISFMPASMAHGGYRLAKQQTARTVTDIEDHAALSRLKQIRQYAAGVV
jgi:hypothetical protein